MEYAMEKRYTILVAGGGRSFSDELCSLLCEEYTVITASTAEETLARAASVPDLVLLETYMPGRDSFELLVELKRNPALVHIPVILTAVSRNEGDEEKGLLLGAVDYIVRPYNGAVVRARIKTHIAIAGQIQAAAESARNDPVSGLPNRRSFDERIAIEWKRSAREKTPVSLLCIFADPGEDAGKKDAFLKAVADILVCNARRPSDLAACTGPGQFAVLLPNTSMNGAVKIAEDIYSRSEAVLGGVRNTSVAATNIGVVSQIPQADMTLEDFFARAEKALSQARASGLICQE
jgi:diguanylate cyclase (GGDEF)-like protein